MKKIAILYPAHFEQSFGGAEIQVRYLHDACLAAGWEVHFIYEEKGKPINPRNQVFLHPIKRKVLYKGCGKGWFLYKNQIQQALNKIQPDVIYTRLGNSWVGFAAQYAKAHGIRHIHALASDNDVEKRLGHRPFYPFFSQIETYWMNDGLKNATRLIAQNEYQQTKAKLRFGQEAIIVNQMTPSVSEDTIQKDNSILKVLWVANFKRTKQPELFVKAVKTLTETIDNVEFYMCGRAPKEYERLMAEIEHIPHLHYLGPLSLEEVFDLMSKSHILVNTSEFEGFSNTFVQAWMRKMMVISMHSNPNEIITKQRIGMMAPDLETLISCLRQAISTPSDTFDMGEKAYTYAIENHSVENNINKILDLL